MFNIIKWLIFKKYSSKDGFTSVTCPNEKYIQNPNLDDFLNLHNILHFTIPKMRLI